MENFDRKKHWETIYGTKALKDVSWYQEVPETSLAFLRELNIEKNARIIDVGGGDSLLADNLLKEGYQNITVLDISGAALERAKKRLGPDAGRITWIEADAASFMPTEKYDVWHDRAAFHFLTDEQEIEWYIQALSKGLSAQGLLVLGTFSEEGPAKCSGIPVKQYSEQTMGQRLKAAFDKIKCITTNHLTPFNTLQQFIFCSFRKKPAGTT